MSDLVKRIRKVEQLYKDAGIHGSEGAKWAGLAADRIEELEAQLAKATDTLLRIVRGDDDAHNWAIHKFACRWTLAELKEEGKLEAIKSASLLGEHSGVMDDDLFDLLCRTEGDKE